MAKDPPGGHSMDDLSEQERRKAIQLLANYPLLERASPRSIEAIITASVTRRGRRGDRVILEGEAPSSVTFLMEGAVRIYHRAEDGREYTPKILSAPNHFGDVELIANHPQNGQSVELLRDSLVVIVPWSTIRAVLLSDHAACIGWLTGLASQFVYTIDADRHNVFSGLPGRVANVLLSYAEVFGRPTRGGVELHIPLSLEQLAREVGSVKRSILRVLHTFKQAGLVESGHTNLRITNARELAEKTLPRRIGLGHRARSPGLLESREI